MDFTNDERLIVDYYDSNINIMRYVSIEKEEDLLKMVNTDENIILNGIEYHFYKKLNDPYKALIREKNEVKEIEFSPKIYYSVEVVNNKERIFFWQLNIQEAIRCKKEEYIFDEELEIYFGIKSSEKIKVPDNLKDVVRYDDFGIVINDDSFKFLKREKTKTWLNTFITVYYQRRKDNKIFAVHNEFMKDIETDQEINYAFRHAMWYLIECSKDFKI